MNYHESVAVANYVVVRKRLIHLIKWKRFKPARRDKRGLTLLTKDLLSSLEGCWNKCLQTQWHYFGRDKTSWLVNLLIHEKHLFSKVFENVYHVVLYNTAYNILLTYTFLILGKLLEQNRKQILFGLCHIINLLTHWYYIANFTNTTLVCRLQTHV